MGGPLQSTFPGTLGWPPTWAAHNVLCVFPSKLALGMFLTFYSPPRFSLYFGFSAPQEQEPFLTRPSSGSLRGGEPLWPGWVRGGKV